MEDTFVIEITISGCIAYYQSNTNNNSNINNTLSCRWEDTDPITIERFLEMLHFAGI